MMSKFAAACILTTALAVAPAIVPAMAQSSTDHTYLTEQTPGTWRASKTVGLGVYNEQDQKVGTINEVLFGKDGKVEGVVIGVGGFLGMGERNVAVSFDQLKWSMTPVRQGVMANGPTPMGDANPAAVGTSAPGLGSPAMPPATSPGAPTAGSTTPRPQMASNDAGPANPAYPDHAILPNASKEQLQKAPEFKYGDTPR